MVPGAAPGGRRSDSDLISVGLQTNQRTALLRGIGLGTGRNRSSRAS